MLSQPDLTLYQNRNFDIDDIFSYYGDQDHQTVKPHKDARYFTCNCEGTVKKDSPVKCWYIPTHGNKRTNDVLVMLTVTESLKKRYGLHSTQFPIPLPNVIQHLEGLNKCLNKGWIVFDAIYDKVTMSNHGMDKFGRKLGTVESIVFPAFIEVRKINGVFNPKWPEIRDKRDSFLKDLYIDFLIREGVELSIIW